MSSFTEVAAGDWDAILAHCCADDAYLSRGYVQVASIHDSGRPVLLRAWDEDGSIIAVVLVRTIAGTDLRDVTSPYGYGGPVAAGSSPPWQMFFEGYEDWCRANRIITSFWRFHPAFIGRQRPAPGMAVEKLAGTVCWEVGGGTDPTAGIQSHHRRLVARARKANVTCEIRTSPATLHDFTRLYMQTMRRRGAADYYLFDDRYWRGLLAEASDRLVLAEAHVRSDVVAAQLCLRGGGWLHYHLGASSDEARALGANHLLFAETAKWAGEQGFNVYHLGGGLGGRSDSLLEFKLRFAPDSLHEMRIGKRIHDETAYRHLAGDTSLVGYFPAYRRTGE